MWEENPGLYHALTCGPPVALLSYIMPMRAITTYFALWGLIRTYVPLPRALEVLAGRFVTIYGAWRSINFPLLVPGPDDEYVGWRFVAASPSARWGRRSLLSTCASPSS